MKSLKSVNYLNINRLDIIDDGKMKKRIHNFAVLIEKDEDGCYIGSVPSLKGCHTQGETIEELLKNIKEAIELCLEVEKEIPEEEFVGVQQIQVKV